MTEPERQQERIRDRAYRIAAEEAATVRASGRYALGTIKARAMRAVERDAHVQAIWEAFERGDYDAPASDELERGADGN